MRATIGIALSCLLLPGSLSAQETLDFEGPVAGTIITSVSSSIGAVQVSGSPTATIIFDSNNPPMGTVDVDLGSPNNMCPDPPGAGPGQGPGGEPGAMTDGNSTENCPLVPLNNVLIVADNLDGGGDGVVDVPNDLADAAAMMTFVWPAPVTISSMTLLDVESSEGAARIDLFTDAAGNNLLASFVLDKTGNNGLRVFDLGDNFGVVRMEVFLLGSGAIDNIVFTPCDTACEDNNACTTDECDPATGLCVHTEIVCDDENECTDDDCDEEDGCVYTAIFCDDENECTDDDCDEEDGCVYTAIFCDDGDECTDDDCDEEDGCVYTPNDLCEAECRVTGGGHDSFGDHRYTFGTQGGAPDAFSGEWTHHEQHGPGGQRFMFHAGTHSAPPGTEVHIVGCSDPEVCHARPAPAKQIDLEGVGSFRNLRNPTADLAGVDPHDTLHWVEIHVEDLGEPGNTSNRGPNGRSRGRDRGDSRRAFGGQDDDEGCPPEGSPGAIAPCDCPDFYRITIYEGFMPGEMVNKTDVIYDVYGYIDGGNFQIHPPIGG